MNHLLPTSLVASRSARVAFARQQFFDEGVAPTGTVSQVVFESWARCLRALGSPRERAEFQPVTSSRTHLALQKNRLLLVAWGEEVPRLEAMLGTTSCAAMLTDATGVLIGATCVGRAHEALMPVATRTGVDLSEGAVGTTAPGVAARTGKAVNVQGGEHFFDNVLEMHCAAAPIHDLHGRLAGVLDISSERIPFAFDAAAVVGLYAGAIENRLLVAQATDHLVVRFQVAPDLLDSAMTGLVGIDTRGRVVWENAVAQRLLGNTIAAGVAVDHDLDQRLGTRWPQLASLPATGATPLTLPNGLMVWARADMRARDGLQSLIANPARVPRAPDPAPPATATDPEDPIGLHADSAPVEARSAAGESPQPAPPAARMRDFDRDLIERVLQACNGNVAQAARRLGVSRGLIYRRLKGFKQGSGGTVVSGGPAVFPNGTTPIPR